MNIKSSFLNALVSPPKLSSERKAEEFLGHIYSMEAPPASPLFRVLSGGFIEASAPFSFDIRSLECFLLLFTKKGCGKLTVDGQVFTLSPSFLLLLDCRKRFRLDIAISPWEYQVLFITGSSLSWYLDLFPDKKALLTPVTPHREIALTAERILAQCKNSSLASQLMISNLIDNLLTECITCELSENAPLPCIPSYLNELRDLFDNAFQADYSLDELEERFGISKYRICREFKQAFGLSPLQYLNRRRIKAAGHLLITSEERIHTIGSMVGIENTNHFIFLFRKFAGCTPLEYRQRRNR